MWWDYGLFKHLPWLTFLIFLHCPGICWWKKRERREKRVEAQRGRKENKELTPVKFPAKAPRDAKAQLCLVSGLGDKALTLSWPERWPSITKGVALWRSGGPSTVPSQGDSSAHITATCGSLCPASSTCCPSPEAGETRGQGRWQSPKRKGTSHWPVVPLKTRPLDFLAGLIPRRWDPARVESEQRGKGREVSGGPLNTAALMGRAGERRWWWGLHPGQEELQ